MSIFYHSYVDFFFKKKIEANRLKVKVYFHDVYADRSVRDIRRVLCFSTVLVVCDRGRGRAPMAKIM